MQMWYNWKKNGKVGEPMSERTYFWIEDCKDKASFRFWETLMHELFPEVVVEGKKNNSELVKAVKTLPDNDNKYIVICDNSFDNVQVYQERKVLKYYADLKSNIFLVDIICFEYVLLEFDKLIQWIYALDDEFLVKRADAIIARDKLVRALKAGMLEYKTLWEVINYDRNLNRHNIEQLAAKLLFDLTRNTGFEVSKGKIGDCWIKACCEWAGRAEDDMCGLDGSRLSISDKMKSIYTGTSLKMELEKLGLEALLC